MNQDPAYQKLREISWRRPLTEAEQAELRVWLVANPAAQVEIEADEVLNLALARLPDAPMPSNFTARVLQAIEREAVAMKPSATANSSRWWRVLLPRIAGVALVVVVGSALAYRFQIAKQNQALVTTAQEVAAVKPLADPLVMADFDVIARLSPTLGVADENLLALSEELLALGQ